MSYTIRTLATEATRIIREEPEQAATYMGAQVQPYEVAAFLDLGGAYSDDDAVTDADAAWYLAALRGE